MRLSNYHDHVATRGDRFEHWTISRRAQRRLNLRPGEIGPIYIAAQATTRHLGGAEEGGWWVDVRETLEVRLAWDWRTAMAYVRELREEWPTCPRGRHSVLGGADIHIGAYQHPSFFEAREIDYPGGYE